MVVVGLGEGGERMHARGLGFPMWMERFEALLGNPTPPLE